VLNFLLERKKDRKNFTLRIENPRLLIAVPFGTIQLKETERKKKKNVKETPYIFNLKWEFIDRPFG
jgi:hypothetical protein